MNKILQAIRALAKTPPEPVQAESKTRNINKNKFGELLRLEAEDKNTSKIGPQKDRGRTEVEIEGLRARGDGGL